MDIASADRELEADGDALVVDGARDRRVAGRDASLRERRKNVLAQHQVRFAS